MSAEQRESSPAGTHIEQPTRRGQACDRCRRRKVKCDGNSPCCGNCLSSGQVCQVSATLQRNRKVRGFVKEADETSQLRADLTKLQRVVDDERKANQELRMALSEDSRLLRYQESSHAIGATRTRQSRCASRKNIDTAYVIKHMGRMVDDANGIGRFAGITTGAHFIQSVEELWSCSSNKRPFKDLCYGLFLACPTSDLPLAPNMPVNLNMILSSDLPAFLGQPVSYYVDQVDVFLKKWEPFCPILIRNQLITDISNLLQYVKHLDYLDGTVDYVTLNITLLIFAINALDTTSFNRFEGTAQRKSYIDMACQLQPFVTAQSSLKCLQSLSLLAFYHQITGQSSELAGLSGLLVRTAQSLALHRHARRFKMSASESELRKRVWWWVYAFDKASAAVLGLPKLISDANVDIEMPLDCIILDISSNELSYPLPGDITPIFFFNHFVSLMKILSTVLSKLYNTKDRHDGVEKITQLSLDLQAWNHALNGHPDVIRFEIGRPLPATISTLVNEDNGLIMYWLMLLANLISIFIHRPGLTFDSTTGEFSGCLVVCMESSKAILGLMDTSILPDALGKMCPLGPGVAFQSALMHVYRYLLPPTVAIETSLTFENTVDIIRGAIGILKKNISREELRRSGDRTDNFYIKSLSESVDTLQTLIASLQVSRQCVDEVSSHNSRERQSSTEYTSAGPLIFDDWDRTMLDSINYADSLDWIGSDMALLSGPGRV